MLGTTPITRKLTALGCLAVTAVAVSACGGSSGSSSPSSSASSPATSSPATSAPAATTTAAASGGTISAAAGKVVFTSHCGTCHTLAAAGTTGTVGPNLDKLKPSMALVVHQVTNGGGVMPAFGGQLSALKIKDVAKYVSSEAGKVKSSSSGQNANGGGSSLP